MHDVVVANGMLLSPSGIRRADLGITAGRVAAIDKKLAGDVIIDAAGCYVMPGGVDIHVHLQMALGGRVSSDSFESGTVAAACGGTTTVIDFVDPQPGQGLMDAYVARRGDADGRVAVDYGLHMTIPTWHAADAAALDEIPVAVAAGCATFKLYQAYERMILDDVALLRVMQRVARAGGSVVVHSETGPVLEELRRQALAHGAHAPIWHERTRPARLEASAILRVAELAHLAGCPLHVFHVGCREGVAEVVAARGRGVDITVETCPQYLLLTAEEHLAGANGALFVCAPPLRHPEDQAELWAGLGDGRVDVVSTDHCPWTVDEKAQPDFTQIPGGVPSIEARMSLVHHFGVRSGRMSLAQWVSTCCTKPAQRMGLTTKGQLAPGFDADVVIFDPLARVRLCAETLHETAGWTPYDGITVEGWPRTVLLRGDTVVQDGVPLCERRGRFVPRTVGA